MMYADKEVRSNRRNSKNRKDRRDTQEARIKNATTTRPRSITKQQYKHIRTLEDVPTEDDSS